MKTAFKIISISIVLALVSCEKDVIVPSGAGSEVGSKRSAHGVLIEPSTGNSGDSDITDPNDRNWRVSNGVDVSSRVTIVDPNDSGNTISKKPKR